MAAQVNRVARQKESEFGVKIGHVAGSPRSWPAPRGVDVDRGLPSRVGEGRAEGDRADRCVRGLFGWGEVRLAVGRKMEDRNDRFRAFRSH
jgi:hypothetical protein